MLIKTTDTESIKELLIQLYIPSNNSHKGQNGRVLIIGGSSLFHSASIWAAEIASHFVDIVHYSSTIENNEIFLSLKKKFHNGIVVAKNDLEFYINEDDAILIGPGMSREQNDEGKYTYSLTKSIIEKFSNKRFVFDAGSLQMMKPDWLLNLKQSPILTPHQIEFERLFKIEIINQSFEEKIKSVEKVAKQYRCIILLKAIDDIISDGVNTYVIKGGNAGLTKGGTGDILAGLTVAFYAKNNPLLSAILASYFIKRSGDQLFKTVATWYNNDDIIKIIPKTIKELVYDNK